MLYRLKSPHPLIGSLLANPTHFLEKDYILTSEKILHVFIFSIKCIPTHLSFFSNISIFPSNNISKFPRK